MPSAKAEVNLEERQGRSQICSCPFYQVAFATGHHGHGTASTWGKAGRSPRRFAFTCVAADILASFQAWYGLEPIEDNASTVFRVDGGGRMVLVARLVLHETQP